MDNNVNMELMKQQERLIEFLGRSMQSRETELHKKLSTIHETNQSGEREDESSTGGIQRGLHNSQTATHDENDMEFDLEEKDKLLERIESLALALDPHHSGVLYLDEMVTKMHHSIGPSPSSVAPDPPARNPPVPSPLREEIWKAHDLHINVHREREQGNNARQVRASSRLIGRTSPAPG